MKSKNKINYAKGGIKELLKPLVPLSIGLSLLTTSIAYNISGYERHPDGFWIKKTEQQTTIRHGSLGHQLYWKDINNDGTINTLEWRVSSARGGTKGVVKFKDNQVNELIGSTHIGKRFSKQYSNINEILYEYNH